MNSYIHLTFTECTLGARHWSRTWGKDKKREEVSVPREFTSQLFFLGVGEWHGGPWGNHADSSPIILFI